MNIKEECPLPQKLAIELWEMILGFRDIPIESGNNMKDKIKLALAQISSKRENKEANLQKIENINRSKPKSKGQI